MPQPSTCPCHLFFRGFKTAACPASNAPNPSNNSYSYKPLPSVFQGAQDCRLPGLKRSKPLRRPPRQQLLQLHAPAICFSGGSRLPFARLQMLQTLPQASKATTLTATCPCHLFFRGFKTAVCPASNAPNPSAGLQGNKRHAPAICFSGGSRLPFARPQTLQTPPQASEATTLTATCPCHLFFKGFKTAVCPASNAPNPSASLQGNNSYSYMPLPSAFQGIQDCRLPGLKRSKPSAGLQGNNSYSYMPLPSVFQGVQDCRLPGLKRSKPLRRPPRQQLLQLHAPAICFSGGSRLPFARPQTLQTPPQASKATTLTATCPCHLFFRGSRLPFARPQTLQTPLFFRGFKAAVFPASNAPNPSGGFQGNNSYSYMPLPYVFPGVQDCRLPGLKRSKPFRRPPRQQLLQLHAPAICFSGGSRLPFARPQTLQTPKHTSKATTLTATCPCHLFFRGFKTAVCPASNAPNPSAGLQGNNSYSYMPLTSVFQGVQDCRLPGLKRSKPLRRPPRQQLLQLHAPAICFSRGSRLPFARPQTLQTPPQASQATTLTATCPCHLFFRGFKTAVCPASNAPTPSAGLQGNNSYSYMPRGSRLPFARPQTLQTPPQASKATTLTATCPCHLFFKGFKTAVCPASNAPNPSAGLQGNNSYSYMPLPSVFQGVQDCRLPGLKPCPCHLFFRGSRLPFARPQTLQTPPQASKATTLTATCPCHLFLRGSRLPFARPQTLQTPPQASKATTLTATCPCHLFFRGFKTAVCPASNAPNPSAGLQGNNSYSYMPLPSVFQEFKTAVCPASNAPNPSAGLQGNNSYSYMPLPSVFQGVQDYRLPGLKRSKPLCFSGVSRLPFARLQTLPAGLQGNNSYSYMPLPSVFQGVQDCRLPGLKRSKPFRRPPRQQLLQLHAPAICFSGGSRLPFARPQTLQTLPQASKATTLTATCPCHLFFKGVQDCRLPGLKRSKPFRRPPRQQLLQLHAPAICFSGVQDCRLPGLKRSKPLRRPPRQQLLQLHAPAICFSGGSRLPFARPQTLQTPPQASKATTLTATCPCHLFFKGFKTAVCPASNAPNPSASLQGNNSYSYMPLPSVFQGVQDCRLPGLKRSKPLRRPPRTTLTATCPCHLFFRGFKTAVCPASSAPNPSAGLQGNNSYSYMPLPSVFPGVQDCRLPGLKRSKPLRRPPRQQLLQLHAPAICFSGGSRLPFARPQTLQTPPQATTLTATCPCHLFFRGFKAAVCPASNAPNPSAGLQGNNSYSYMPLPSVCQGVQDCRLPGLKRSKPFRRPPRQQLLQLHAPAIWFSGGSRLPFARPQTLQTPPQASKATTLTATWPCHLFVRGFNPSAGLQGNNSYSYMPLPSVFHGFKTAVCPASNPPNPSAGLQGNNSYSYMPLPSVFQGVQDCRLPGLKRSKPFRRPPRQQLLQLHAPAICFSGGSRLPFARPQTLQTLPQASKATTLTATCPCHLFVRGFKTAVCPASNAPNPSAGLQGNNSYSYMPLPSVFQGVQDCRLPGFAVCPASNPPNASASLSKATTLTATCPCHLFFTRFKTAVCPALPFARLQTLQTLPQVFPRQQLLHAFAIWFVGRSSLPFARPQTLQTLQTLPTLPQAPTPSRQLPPSFLAVSLCCPSVAASFACIALCC